MTPSELRSHPVISENQLPLTYRATLHWSHMLAFYQLRLVKDVESIEGQTYRRNVRINAAVGWFSITPQVNGTLLLKFGLSDVSELKNLVTQVRRVFDLDADLLSIEQHLAKTGLQPILTPGLRIPGVWSTWEAGVRAIIGQQVSLKAAIGQLNALVQSINSQETVQGLTLSLFPTPQQVVQTDLSFLKMPTSRKETLHRFAEYMCQHPDKHPTEWLALKGIGPWTVNYAQLRGLSEPNCFLATDLVVKKALAHTKITSPDSFSPWGSYATFHCWNAQS